MDMRSWDRMDSLHDWIDNFVTKHNYMFGGIPCPYARKAMKDKTVDIRESTNIQLDLHRLLKWDDKLEAVILHADTNLMTSEELSLHVRFWNHTAMLKDIVALEDHPDDPEIVKGVKMNYGKGILVIVQRLSKLNQASDKLAEMGYYDDWEQENFNDVVSWRTPTPK